MSDYLGDFTAGDVIYIERCFVNGGGDPTAVSSGSAVCKRMGTTNLAPQGVGAITTSGGLCTLAIFTGSSSAFFTRGDFSIYMGGGTVTGSSVVGYTLGQFSLGRFTTQTFSANVLTWLGSAPNVLISGRVDANANAAIASATISSNVLQISGAAVNTSSAQLGVNAVNIGGTAAALTTLSANVVKMSASGLKNFFDTDSGTTYASAIAGSVVFEIGDNAGAAITVQNIVDGVWNEPAASHVSAGTTGAVITNTANYSLVSAYDFAKGTVAMTESYGAVSGTVTPAQALHMLLQNVCEFSISGTTITVKKLDKSTTAETFTLDSATTPTSRTRAT